MNIIRKLLNNRCLVLSELVYGLFHIVDRWADYKVNIVLSVNGTAIGGHAWVTRNERNFLNHSVPMERLQLVGATDKYRYYIKEND